MNQCKIIAIGIQKGGCGKTSSTQAIAACLAKYHGKRVLVVDLEPTGNLTFACNIDSYRPNSSEKCYISYGNANAPHTKDGVTNITYANRTIHTLLTTHITSKDCCFPCGELDKPFKQVNGEWPCTYDIVPSDPLMSASEQILIELGKEYRLQQKLDTLRPYYDYILLDTAPAYGVLVINALTAADYCLIPLETSWFALQGIGLIHNTIQDVKKFTNPELQNLGFLPIKYESSTELCRNVMAELRKIRAQTGIDILPTGIRRCNIVGKAQGYRISLFDYDSNCNAADDYRATTRAILKRVGDTNG